MSVKDQLFKNVTQSASERRNKITIVGSGNVASATAFAILTQGISNDVVIIGRNEEKVEGEMMDLQHGLNFLNNANISGGTDLNLSTGSKLIIFAAGTRRSEGESRIDLVQRNVNILKTLVPKLVHCSPDAVFLMVSSPCDIMAYVAWKLSGLPKHRIIGVGTNLDSSRFRSAMSQRFQLAPASVQGWIIGEHGESSVAVWSGVNIAGIKLRDINKSAGLEGDPENWSQVYEEVTKIAGEVTKLKGYTTWAIALSCADIASAIINSTNEIKTVSTFAKGLYGINQQVFMSLPCTLNSNGISNVINIKLDADEQKQLRRSANLMDEIHKGISF